jgi:hypothetical protein
MAGVTRRRHSVIRPWRLVLEIRRRTNTMARRIKTPRSTHPQGVVLDDDLAVVVVVVGWVVDVVVRWVVVVAGALVVVVGAAVVVVVAGGAVVVVGGGVVVVVVGWAPAPLVKRPS